MPRRNTELKPGPEQTLGHRLKLVRETHRKMSSVELHRKTGISKSSLTRYEKGDRTPGTSELRALCDALKVSPQFLIYGDEEQDFGPINTNVFDLEFESDRHFIALATALLQGLPRPDRTAFLQLMMSMFTSKVGENDATKLTDMVAAIARAASEELEDVIETFVDDFVEKHTEPAGQNNKE